MWQCQTTSLYLCAGLKEKSYIFLWQRWPEESFVPAGFFDTATHFMERANDADGESEQSSPSARLVAAAVGCRGGASKGLEMLSWLTGGNRAPMKHFGQFSSGSSLLCKVSAAFGFPQEGDVQGLLSPWSPFILFWWI